MPVCRVCAVWSVCLCHGALCVVCVEILVFSVLWEPAQQGGEVKGDESGVMAPSPRAVPAPGRARGPVPGMVSGHTCTGRWVGARCPGTGPLPAQMASQVVTSAALCKTSFEKKASS